MLMSVLLWLLLLENCVGRLHGALAKSSLTVLRMRLLTSLDLVECDKDETLSGRVVEFGSGLDSRFGITLTLVRRCKILGVVESIVVVTLIYCSI